MKTLKIAFKHYIDERKAKRKVRLSRSRVGTVGIFIFLAIMSCFMILPLLYSVIHSLKPIDEIFAFPPRFFVRHPTVNNYIQLFHLADNLWVPFTRYLFNSLFVSILGTVFQVIVAALVAFPLAKGHFKFGAFVSQLVIFAMLFHSDTTSVARYIIVAKLGMIDTYYSMILPALASTTAVFLLQQFIVVSVADATLEAARIDGASEFRIFKSIIVPSIKPALMTVVIFTFQGLWNSSSSAYIYSEELKLLPSVLSTISSGGIARAGAAAAVSVVLMVPPILVFLYSQSSVMETMSHSGLK